MSANKKPITRSKRAGLTLSVSRVDNVMRSKNYSKKYGNECAVFMTGVLEYLVKEIISSSANDETKRIQPKSLSQGLAGDLQILFANAEIGSANFN